MLFDHRLAELLMRWEQHRVQGRVVSAEELCRDCPDLAQELAKRMSSLQKSHSLHSTPCESDSNLTTPAHPKTAGLPVVGDYQILGELGRGGMGIVYQAYDRKRQEMVALKTLYRMDPSAVYRLKQEFRALADVTHPNLVGLYEMISTSQQCVIAMELIDGEHFLAWIRTGAGTLSHQAVKSVELTQLNLSNEDAAITRVSDATAAQLSPIQYDRLRAAFLQLAHGISALHALGKLHRDIKPSNVMVTREARVVLLDFGLAAELDWEGVHQSTELHVTGTVAYMAPEQAASRAQSAASDWYSVGVMLYEALTGQLPFTGSPIQVLIDKQQREPSAPADVVPGIPVDLNQLCVALMRKSPEDRPIGKDVLQRLTELPGSNSTVIRNAVSAPRATFVGRELHMANLIESFSALRKGRTAVVCLHGRSGVGKSMLAQHFLDDLVQRNGAVVLAGKCYERESVPYKALDSLVDALSRNLRRLPTHEVQAVLPREAQILAQVFPVLQRVAAVAAAPGRTVEISDAHELRRRAFEALRELFARLGDRKPLVLFIDDLQWGDLDGVTQLLEILRPPDAPVLLLLAGYRSEDVDTSPCLAILHKALGKFGTAIDQRQVSVDPLDHDEARELALTLLGDRGSASLAQAETIARESGGNPFFVHELVQCIDVSLDVVVSLTAGALVLDEVLWSRIQSLSDEPRRLLEVIAVSGQPLRLTEVRQAAALRVDEHGALAVLRSGRLIRSSGSADLEEVETYHDRVRETILSHLPIAEVKDIHHRIAMVIESSIRPPSQGGAGPVQTFPHVTATVADDGGTRPLKSQTSKRIFDLAYHFDAAGNSQRALPYAMAMADQARSQYALEIAEQLYRIAERGAAQADHATRYRVAESLGDVLMLRGRYSDAEIRFKAALALTTDPLTQAKIEGKLGELAFKCGDMKTAIEATERALRKLGNRVPRWSATFICGLLRETLVQILHTLFPRIFLARQKLDGAEKALLTIRLHNRLSYCYWFGKDRISCLWTHLRGMNLAERHPPTLELAQAYSNHAPVMSLVPCFSRGIAYAQKSFAIYKSFDDLLGQGQALNFSGVVLYAASRFEECIEKCREASRLFERSGDLWEVNVARVHIAFGLFRLGELPRCAEESRRIHLSGLELGDTQASGFSLDVWAQSTGGRMPFGVLQQELQRPRTDVQVTAQVMLAEGVRLFMLDRVVEAAVVFENGCLLVETAGLRNAYVLPLRSWLASALRRQAQNASDSHAASRSALIKRADKIARQALRTARTFQNDLPHALRECGLIAALLGQARQARQNLNESLNVAERQGGRFEHAQTLLARGQVGHQFGWPEAQQDLNTARQALHSLGADFALDNAVDF